LFSQVNKPVVSIDGYEKVPENDEDALLKAAANQPISVAIDAGGSDFQFYSEVNFRKLLKYFVNFNSIQAFPLCEDDKLACSFV
jgi:hypothetical protein